MIDLAAAKAWLKVETAADDAVITGLVNASVAHIEAVTGKFMSVKAFSQAVAGFPSHGTGAIKLFKGPVLTITAIAYDPADGGAEATVSDFRLAEGINATLLPAYGESWPVALDGAGTVRISGTAGYPDDEAPELDQAALMLVAHWYANREAVNVGNITSELPFGVRAIIGPYMPVGLA